ncbi:MAG: CDP-alcohol phosphatidyltransferase family protein, partial [Bacteroidota bacterium]
MRKYIPNTITLINLFCGCAATVSVLYGDFVATFWFLFAGGWADYLDGMVARWLKVNSVLGKELDSMADMVSFGVAPGAILYMLLHLGWQGADSSESLMTQLDWRALPGFLVSVFAGLRLARFNLDERQTEDFIGLATPSMTMFVTGLMVIFYNNSLGLGWLVSHPYLLYAVAAFFSFLMVAEIPMFSFKFKGAQWKGNEWRYSFIALTVLMLLLLREASFS